MKLSEVITSDFAEIYDTDEAAVEIDYTEKDATAAVTIPAFVQFQGDLQENVSGLVKFAEVRVRVSDIARPGAYDKFTFDGLEYTILDIIKGNKYANTMRAYADPRQVPNAARNG